MFRQSFARAVAPGVLALTLAAAAADAEPVQYTRHLRTLAIAVPDGAEPRSSTAGGAFDADLDASQTSDAFDLFASAVIQSIHDDSGVRTSGQFLVRSETRDEGSLGSTDFVGPTWTEVVNFEISTPHRWTAVESSSPPLHWEFRTTTVAGLQRTDDDDSDVGIRFLGRPNGSGVLEPGTYSFSAHIDFTSTEPSSFPTSEREVEFSYSLQLEPIDAAPIPLPPAAVPGLVTLAGAALVAGRRGRGLFSG